MIFNLLSAQSVWIVHALLGLLALGLVWILMLRTKGYLRNCFLFLLWALIAYVFFHGLIIFSFLFAKSPLDPAFVSAVVHIPFLILLLIVLYKLLHLVRSVGGRRKKRGKLL